MTDLDLFESLRPDVEPLTEPDRARIRHALFGNVATVASAEPSAVDAAVHYDLDRGLVRNDAPPAPGGRGLLSLAAACLVVVGIAAVWFTVGNREPAEPATAQQPSSTPPASGPVPAEPESPVWYSTLRPLLPSGFDQIVLTDAMPEVVGFKAFRTGTRQMLDITITLQTGYDLKQTGEAVTFSDEQGNYIESAGSVALTTTDQRLITIRCGLRPIGGGTPETGGLLDADRDTCDDGVDNLELDPTSRRTLAARLAAEFPTNIVSPGFGQPDTSPEATAVAQIVNDYAGGSRPFGAMQADGVLRVANLSPVVGEPATTELTVINGIWPPDGDGSAFDDTYANNPQGRFYTYGDIAAALVVADGTGYHIATTDLSETNLVALGTLLQELIAVSPGTTSPVATITNPPTPQEVAPDVTNPSDPSTATSPTPSTMLPNLTPTIEPGSVVCVSAGASPRAMTLCEDELGGQVVEADTSSEDSFIMPVDPDNPQHRSAAQHLGDLLGLPVRDTGLRLVATATAVDQGATSYLVIGTSDAPYIRPANPGQGTPTTVSGATGAVMSSDEQTYTVVAGDTVERIGARYGFTSDQLDVLVEYNGWANADVTIWPGYIVRIPPGAVIPPND